VETRPSDPRLRQNGTYMVLRKLEQDVVAFRQYVAETAQLLGMEPEMCAAKFVGRWRSGAPLELTPDHDDPKILDDPATADAFAYRAPSTAAPNGDADGTLVPHLAHIRRVNPRDSLSEHSMIDPTNHRIIRRAAPYGPYLDEAAPADGVERGLLFRAFNASILDQFEMIQSEWVNNANEANGLSSDRDPLVGSVEPVGPEERQLGASFTIPRPDGSCPTRYGLPQFVTVRGGEYFFIPSITALKTLATAVPGPGPQPPPKGDPAAGFVAQFEAIASEKDRTPAEIAREQTMLVLEYQDKLVALGDDLRASDATKIFSTPIGYLLATYADITEVFTHDEAFSVCGYGERLADATGAFMLGMDAGPQYDHETAVMRSVAPSWELPAVGEWIGRYAAQVVGQAALAGTFDLVTVANRVPLGFVAHYFGVPGPNDDIFMTWLRVVGVHVFEFWSPLDPRIKQMVGTITPVLEQYLDTVIQSRLGDISAGAPVPDDVLTRLLALAGEAAEGIVETPGGLDLLGIRRNLAGFAVGSSVALSVAIVSAVQYLLQPENSEAYQVTVAAAEAGNVALVSQCMLEAARLGAPSPPSLFRTASTDYVLARGTARETVIPKGSIVALYPVVAMTDPEFVDDPLVFRPGRSPSNYVMFGEGMHTCFGTATATMLLGAVGLALFKLPGLHEVAPMTPGQGIPGTYYPGRYPVAVGT
ncbi:MAG: cytochrome P450, partial [Acidimicrobiia bacterium]